MPAQYMAIYLWVSQVSAAKIAAFKADWRAELAYRQAAPFGTRHHEAAVARIIIKADRHGRTAPATRDHDRHDGHQDISIAQCDDATLDPCPKQLPPSLKVAVGQAK